VTYAYGNFPHIFEIPDPDFPIHYTTCMALRLRQIELSPKMVHGPVLNTTQLSAHVQNVINLKWGYKSITHDRSQRPHFLDYR